MKFVKKVDIGKDNNNKTFAPYYIRILNKDENILQYCPMNDATMQSLIACDIFKNSSRNINTGIVRNNLIESVAISIRKNTIGDGWKEAVGKLSEYYFIVENVERFVDNLADGVEYETNYKS